MPRYENNIDPRSRSQARQAARAAWAGAEETKKLENRAANYVPGYGNPSPQNSPTGLTPQAQWDDQFKPTLRKPAAPPTSSPTPSVPPTPSAAPSWPAEKARIERQYGPSAAPAITPPTSIVPQGNPNALKPGEGWQSPTIDPRGASTVRAPDGIIERVGSAPGKGGGNIASMYRPPAYNGPGESPTGIVHNNIPKPAPVPQPPSSTPTPPPLELQKQAIAIIPDLAKRGSAANTAYVEMFRRTGSHQAALEAAQATQPAPGSALPAEYAKISPY